MALIRKLEPMTMDSNRVHEPVDCTYTTFTDETGSKYLQIDTYGSSSRKIKGKKSQSLQFNEKSLKELKGIIEDFTH
jgi:hypothetical protein